jgi:hypothetical protein
MVVRVVGFDPRCDPAQPGPAQPGSRAPGAHTPHAPPPPLPLSFGFPAQQPLSPSPTSLSPWCPRDWRRRSPEFGPRGELPSPPFSSLSPSLPLPPLSPCARPLFSPLRARVPARRRGTPPRPSPSPSGAGTAPPLRSPVVLGPPLRSPAALGPAPPLPRPARPLLSPLRRCSARPCSLAPRRVPARARLGAGVSRRERSPCAGVARHGRSPCAARGLGPRRRGSGPCARPF